MSAVEQLKSVLRDQPEAPIRPQQADDLKQEHSRLKSMLSAPAWMAPNIDRKAAGQRLRAVDKTLKEQAPRDLGPNRDKVLKLADEVLHGTIRPSMLSRAEMRRNPSGAVDAFRRREGSPAVKDAILTWRRALRAADPGNADSDYTNVERYRPEGGAPGASSFMADAQIPGSFAMTPLARENWPLGEPKVDTALKQAKRVESAETIAKRQAALDKARQVLAAKRAAAKAPVPLLEPVEPVYDSQSEPDSPAYPAEA